MILRLRPWRISRWHGAIRWDNRSGNQDSYENITGLISEEEFLSINEHKNVSLAILGLQVDSIKQLFDEGNLDRFSRLQLWETVERLTASMGRCERIKNTVFPTTCRQGLHMAIYLFVIFLAPSESLQFSIVLEVLILVIISMVFFFLEKATFRIQDPLKITRLTPRWPRFPEP